jgi:hypothetical protein
MGGRLVMGVLTLTIYREQNMNLSFEENIFEWGKTSNQI